MKVQDLMIGDYVRVKGDCEHKPFTVGGIKKDGNLWLVYLEEADTWYETKSLEPIGLTAEILVNNGLPNHRYSDSDFCDYEEWSSEDKRLRVLKDNQGTFARVEDEKRMYTVSMGVANWVNEWQHILRQGGIKKEIELEKEG